MTVSFTGTRKGMSQSQERQLHYLLSILAAAVSYDQTLGSLSFRHGGAKGADLQADAIAEQWIPRKYIRAFPPPPGESPLIRDKRDIAMPCHLLIAAPHTDTEELRSGTWATVRYARAAGKPVIMLSRRDETFEGR